MSAVAQRPATFDELYRAVEALPPGLTGEILEPGVIRTMSRPGAAHRFTAREILGALREDEVGRGGRWWLEQEAEVRLGDRLVVPDLAGWRLEVAEPSPPGFVYQNPILRRPDWCCEILFPSTEAVDRDLKVPLYASAEIEWIWLVEPTARTVEVMRTRAGEAVLVERVAADARRAIAPFAAVLDLGRWWLESR